MSESSDRRRFFRLCAACVGPLAWASKGLSQQPAAGFKTYTYKVAAGCEIKADVYGAADETVRPALIWVHGGALISGHRGGMNRLLRDMALEAGYVVVSIDYRLAPETKLPEIIKDLEDACVWVRERGPSLFHIDPNRIAVSGGSAGGYLTLMSGFLVQPRPRALVSFWGYGDITGAWYSRPDPFYNRRPKVHKEEAYGAVGARVISEASGKHNRGRFYLYCRQHGIWPNEVAGRDPAAEPEWFDAYCPVRNVTPEYPPTLLIHGDQDTDVPYEQSVMMAEQLKRAGVQHELITVRGAGHGLSGADPARIRQVNEQAMAFLRRYLE